jgi:hypothetical protein
MKKYFSKTLIAAACGLAMSAGAQAATVAFEHTDPNDFRDIRATDQGQAKFEERVLRELEDQFRKEAAALPEGQTLQVTVKDLDLAGDVEYFHRWYPFGLRVVRNVDFPRMEFSYVLRDANGRVLSEGDEELSDMSFRFNTLIDRTRDPLDYERRLISEWAKENLRG